ncbi:hypothetical protein [Streptomyces sp. NPDC088726]|uniref:hypothetical protein n=1 Tax=Streptomyces sp. NPDC088726 TaxID=3365874 RepID=UPI00381A658B
MADLMSRRLIRESTPNWRDARPPRPASTRVRRPLPQYLESLIHQINTLMQTRRRQADALTHHSDGLHVPSGRDEAVHLRPHLDRKPFPHSIPHTCIEPDEPYS